MSISDKLALEIFTIELAHIIAVLVAFSFMAYFWLKAKHMPLLYSFLSLIGMLMLWMVSKIFKTVAPNESIRWFFIVTQYLGVEFTGYFLVVFALYYTHSKYMGKLLRLLLAVPPSAAFLTVLTNPLHMKFYSYFDFYKDSFGPLFFPTQGVLYLYLLAGIVLLSSGFTRQPQFERRKAVARLFAAAILVPIGFNSYYLLVKLTDVRWVLDIPFFDFTPITSTAALLIFIIPAFRYRFLDLVPYAGRIVFNQHPCGLAIVKNNEITALRNDNFHKLADDPSDLNKLKENLQTIRDRNTLELHLDGGRICLVSLFPLDKSRSLLYLKDVTPQASLKSELEAANEALLHTNHRLKEMRDMAQELAAAKIKTQIAQDVHDIFGHTLIVVLGLIDLAVQEPSNAPEKLSRAKELLRSGVLDLRLALDNGASQTGQSDTPDRIQFLNEIGVLEEKVKIANHIKKTTLEEFIHGLSNDIMDVDFSLQGNAEELDPDTTEALSRICQEAVTNALRHGKADLVTIILRFQKDTIELYIIDNGKGCINIVKSLGLSGMEKRAASLDGTISYGSDGEKGFYIHVIVPRIGAAAHKD